MAKDKSFAGKIAKTRKTSQTLTCACGGDIKVFSVFKDGKIKPEARCSGCSKVARKPKELMY